MLRWLSVFILVGCCPSPVGPDAGTAASLITVSGSNGAAGAWVDGPAGAARYNQPEGLALSADSAKLYVADSANHVIRQIELPTGVVSTLAGAATEFGFADSDVDGGARLSLPRNLVLAPGGRSLYFTDTGNSVIRRLDLDTNRVTTEFGTPGVPGSGDGVGRDAGFGRKGFLSVQPWGGGLIIDPSAPSGPLMYVADSANQTIRAVNLSTRAVTTLAGRAGIEGHLDGAALEATFNKPSGLVLSGRALYITEANNLTIRKLDLDSREVTTAAGKAPDNPKHFCENVSPVIPRECGSVDSVRGLEARFRFPFGVAPDDRGGFFLADSHNNLIRRFEIATGTVTTAAGTQQTVLDDLERPSKDTGENQPGTLSHPSHLVYVPPRTLYVADRSANCIRRVELAH
jgi:sugar lactone lactonase YvrE